MSAFEALVLEVGVAVSSAIVKAWVRDADLLAESGSMKDLLRKAGLDFSDSRKLTRQLEESAERLCERLRPFFEIEYQGGLAPNEQHAAIHAVARVVAEGFSDPEVALEHDLSADRLARSLRAAAERMGVKRDLGEAGSKAVDMALAETAACLTQIVTGLPSFHGLAMKELLARTRAIADQISEAIDRVPQVEEREVLEFSTRYARAILNRYDSLRIFGLNRSRAARRYALDTSYITLGVSIDYDALCGEPILDSGFEENAAREPGGRSLTQRIDEAVAPYSRMILRGPAGSGKTTFLQWLAVKAAQRSLPDSLREYNGAAPFIIRARKYADGYTPAVRYLADDGDLPIATPAPEKWVEALLASGRCIVMVDGIDELPAPRRPRFMHWLEGVIRQYPSAKYVITSRPGVDAELFAGIEGVVTADMQAMTSAESIKFIKYWHDAVGRGVGAAGDEFNTEDAGDRLQDAVRSLPSVRRLITNPLMCAVVCALNLESSGSLPESRAALYEDALRLLIESREKERGVSPILGSGLSFEKQKVLLRDLAGWMLRNGYSECGRSDVVERFAKSLERVEPTAEAIEEVDRMLERSGVLREPAAEKVDFVHRTFLEYLAALQIVDGEDYGLLVRQSGDPAWDEVVILAAGTGTTKGRREIIRGLLERAGVQGSRREHLQLLSASCVDVSPGLDPELRSLVSDAVEKLVPPQNLKAASRIASAGELAVSLLKWRDDLTEAEARASVHALGEIGTDAARHQVAGYALDGRASVVAELVLQRHGFDGDYARSVLSECCVDGGILDAPESGALEYLEHMDAVTRLIVRASSGSPLCDWESICRSPGLTSVDLTNVRISGEDRFIAPLGSCIQHVALRSVVGIRALDFLQGTSLARLTVSNAPDLESIAPLAVHRETLRSVALDRTAVTDLSALSPCDELTNLELSRCAVESLQPLSELSDLGTLVLRDIDGDIDAHWLALCPGLSTVRIAYCSGSISVADFDRYGRGLDHLEILCCSDLESRLEELCGVDRLSVKFSGLDVRLNAASSRCGWKRLELAGSGRLVVNGLPDTLDELTVSGFTSVIFDPDVRSYGGGLKANVERCASVRGWAEIA